LLLPREYRPIPAIASKSVEASEWGTDRGAGAILRCLTTVGAQRSAIGLEMTALILSIEL